MTKFPAKNLTAINLCYIFVSQLTGPDIVKIAEGNTLEKGTCRFGVAEHGGTFSMYHH